MHRVPRWTWAEGRFRRVLRIRVWLDAADFLAHLDEHIKELEA
jgi:hypothetical protein